MSRAPLTESVSSSYCVLTSASPCSCFFFVSSTLGIGASLEVLRKSSPSRLSPPFNLSCRDQRVLCVLLSASYVFISFHFTRPSPKPSLRDGYNSILTGLSFFMSLPRHPVAHLSSILSRGPPGRLLKFFSPQATGCFSLSTKVVIV